MMDMGPGFGNYGSEYDMPDMGGYDMGGPDM
jgi:hypothetical protein